MTNDRPPIEAYADDAAEAERDERIRCPDCNGEGITYYEWQPIGRPHYTIDETCYRCGGHGVIRPA